MSDFELPKDLPKKENFSEWYNEVIERAELSDKRYAIKGMNVWMPYGWKIMLNIDELIREECNRTGHEEVYFPLLIPETEFAKEAEHIKGFTQEVYWVTHAGDNKLDIKLLLRPTSETAMYPIFSLWIRSHADLPLKTFQIVNTFRYETKQTRSFIRVREIHFFEAHTCHRDFEDAERQIKEDLEILSRFARRLCLPYRLFKRPEWDKFAGAFYSIGIDTLFPTGRTLQLGSIHQYKENFSRPYNITYEDENGEHKFVHQTTYGMSERLVGAIVGIHGDDKGLVLPPQIAPLQVVIVPVLMKGRQEEITNECRKLKDKLESNNLRVHLDDRDIRPGNKYYHWELRGVPIRVEIGPRDVENRKVILVRRDTAEKVQVGRENVVESVKALLDDIADNLLEKAESNLKSSIFSVESIEEAKKKKGILRIGWCGEEFCGKEIEETLEVSTLGTPLEKEDFKGKCLLCGKETEIVSYVAKSM